MYDELIKNLRGMAKGFCPFDIGSKMCGYFVTQEAADAIEELQKDLKRGQDYYEFWKHKAEQELKMLQVVISNMPCWIPVTERLPEDRNMVLATVDGVVRVAFYGNYMWEEVETYSIFYPTHWMPLPQPPKEDEE